MIKNHIIFASILVIFTLISTPLMLAEGHPHQGTNAVFAHDHEPQTEIIPLNGLIGIEKTQILFHASSDNTLPWGFVEGIIANPVDDYPVIIQIYDESGKAFHFAQTNVNEDGSYEYKFRVSSFDGVQSTNVFEGNYIVEIFKVVYLDNLNLV